MTETTYRIIILPRIASNDKTFYYIENNVCGIFGILYHRPDKVPEDARLKKSAELLRHRGPDSSGIYSGVGIGLAHTRLSLLDLSERGSQPFRDPEGRYILVYNGEVYNFKALRGRLESRGIKFRSDTDTEVVLESIKCYGIDAALPRFEGMFAFGLYDLETETLTLARDRFGIKPLFYSDGNDAFIFASEVAALRPWLDFEPDPWSISSFLFGYGGPSKAHTFYKGIKILTPGGILSIQKGKKASVGRFFSLPDFYETSLAFKLKESKPKAIIDQVEEKLFNSVELQYFADAPVGTLCSGGLDSALITAIAAKNHHNVAVFHADVIGRCSEYEWAKKLADYLKLDLKTVRVTDTDCLNDIPVVMKHFGHPFYTLPSSIPFLAVSRLVRESGVKGVLTGEGSDECFLGYPFLVPDEEKDTHMKGLLKQLAHVALGKAGHRFPYHHKKRRFINGFSPFSTSSASSSALGPQSAEFAMQLLNRFEVVLETEDLKRLFPLTEDLTDDYATSIDLMNYNLRSLLHRNDTMGMAASIESRFPYLDSQLVKLAVNLPDDLKIHYKGLGKLGGRHHYENKWVLRRVAERYLPKELFSRPKEYFRYDVFRRMNIKPDFFTDSFISETFEFSTPEIDLIIEKFPQGLKLRLFHLEIWAQSCLWNHSVESIRNKLMNTIEIRQPMPTDRFDNTG